MRTKDISCVINQLRACNKEDQIDRFIVGGMYKDGHIEQGKYVVEYQEDEYDAFIYIWNPDRPCIFLALDKSDHTAVLNKLEYSPQCTIDGRMKQGEGTVDMLKYALQIAKQKGVQKVMLTDKSTFQCNGKKVDLGMYSFLRYGQTWYERKFGFYPTGHATEYEQVKQNRLNLPDLEEWKNKPCDFFTEPVVRDLMKRLDFIPYKWVWELSL